MCFGVFLCVFYVGKLNGGRMALMHGLEAVKGFGGVGKWRHSAKVATQRQSSANKMYKLESLALRR